MIGSGGLNVSAATGIPTSYHYDASLYLGKDNAKWFAPEYALDSFRISVNFLSVNDASKSRFNCKILLLISLSIALRAAVSRAQQGAPPTTRDATAQSPYPSTVEIITPTEGVNFSSYVNKMIFAVKNHWFVVMPDSARAGEKGKVIIRFQIRSDGKVENITVESSSGDDSLDQAALRAVRDSSPLDPLPPAFKGSFLSLRFLFRYNLPVGPADWAPEPPCNVTPETKASAPPFDRLEFLAFAFGSFDVPYAKRIICRRGISFNPDSAALHVFRVNSVTPGLVETVSKLTPRLAKDASPDRDRAFVTLQHALQDVHDGQGDAADIDYKQSLRLAGDSASLHSTYATFLTTTGRYIEAEAEARRSLELWADNADAHVVLALALSLQDRDADAVLEAREALRICPDHTGALVDLGFALARSGQYSAAIPILRNAIVRVPNMPVTHKHLGGCLVHTRDFDGAIKELTVFLATNSNDAEAHYFLGVALRENGKAQDAQIQFRDASSIEPTNPLYSAIADKGDSGESSISKSTAAGPRPDDGFPTGNVYTNRFFGFSYEFPRGWVVLDPERSRAMTRIGGSILANGDPILTDVAEVAARNAYPLLLVAKETTKGITTSVDLIQIQAFDKRFVYDAKSGEDFVKLMALVLQRRFEAVSVVGPPEQFVMAGRTFWKAMLNVTVHNEVGRIVEVVMVEKGYLLLFVFACRDSSKLDDLVGSLQSIQFTETSR